MKAPDFCTKAAALMEDRGKERDQADGERSMARCVAAFNAMTRHTLTEEDGWLFMVYLKHARMRGGHYKQDDYEDAVAYEALMAESAGPELVRSPVVLPKTILPEATFLQDYEACAESCSGCNNLCPRNS